MNNGTWQWWEFVTPVLLQNFNWSQWHTVKVEADGTQFRCYLDGGTTPILTDSCSNATTGTAGLRVSAGSASFDNVKVLPLP